jgi:D-alanyl-D-alanine carboxypeptidase (penicillin-binding protein 5/6)
MLGLALAVLILLSPPGAEAAAPGPQPVPPLGVRAAIVIEQSTGQQLLGIAPNAELPIASATKLMTALVVMEQTRLDQVFAEPNYYPAASFSQIGLRPGERMSIHDLLLALMLPSADDAAEDLAYNVGGHSVARFIGMMNARARELGLTHTHYSTPIGLDTPGNYSSASDLVRLASYVLAGHPWFKRAVALRSAVLHSGSHPRYVVNRNTLLGQVPWINGVKTGHTYGAGYVLVGSGTRGGMTLLSAVLGTASEGARDANTLAALNYGFANFTLVQPVTAGVVIRRPTVRDRPHTRVDVVAGQTLKALVRRDAAIALHVRMPRELVGPLARHAVVGSLVVTAGRRTIGTVPLLLAKALPAVSPLAIFARWALRPGLLALLALLVAAVGLAVRRGRAVAARRREREEVESQDRKRRTRAARADAEAARADAEAARGVPPKVGGRA